MKIVVRILIVLMVGIFIQCKKKKSLVKQPKITKEKAIKKEIITKSWDSLNRNNVEVFFTEYGKKNPETKVIIKTKFGNIKLKLYEDTPIHRANFIFLTKIKYFNTTVIYRVAKNFVIQGGNSDNLYTVKQRKKYGNYLIKPEFRKYRKHKYGALAIAREYDNNPNKLSSPFEFYMVHKRDGAFYLDNEHTVFGEVISGFDTMDKISKVKVSSDEWPIDDIPLTVEIIK